MAVVTEKVTIKRIAELAGVAPSTVSYALNGGRKISAEVKARIDRVVRQLNYRPSYTARVMTSKRTGLIAVLVDQCENPASTQLLTAVGRELAAHSYEMLLSVAGSDPAHALALLEKFNTGMADGIINMLPWVSAETARSRSAFVPTVTFMRDPDAPVTVDFAGCAGDALTHLWELGHRRIGLITTTCRSWGQDPCLDGYRRFMAAREWPCDAGLVFSGDGTVACGRVAAEQLTGRGATAIFAGNDQMAVGVYQWAYAQAIRIPETLSVIGFDDCPLAQAVFPPLTTIPMPIDALAHHTVETLLSKIAGGESRRQALLLHPVLVRRASTAPVRFA